MSTSQTRAATPLAPRLDLRLSRGSPMPFGPTPTAGGVNFAVYARNATAVTLVIFEPGSTEALIEFPLDPKVNRTGDVWHLFVHGLRAGIEYGYRAARDPERVDDELASPAHFHRYDPAVVLVDPYARLLARYDRGAPADAAGTPTGAPPRREPHPQWRGKIVTPDLNWRRDQPLNRHLADTIIYEVNVRSFTRHPSSGVDRPGTYDAIIEKIPYLKELGITAVELLPVTEFDELDVPHSGPDGRALRNLWGYDPVSFFACKTSYAAEPGGEHPIHEFKRMVEALHDAGIEVILDIVFNHTGEGGNGGPTSSFRGFDNETYYMLDPATGDYKNFSGCGNTLNCNHPVVRDLILDSLRYWVTEMHVDGFRFDLAAILHRGRDGEVMAEPPIIERIAHDPVLARTKLLAEAWDAAGLYLVGEFPAWERWAEWNGKFRDDVRRFVKSDPGMTGALASRLLGSPDLYLDDGRGAHHSINFVTSHDGFTLRDLVSYERKHNEANGEDNRDGNDCNWSWNCGIEGPTDSEEINELRMRQMKNLATLLLMSHGVPMFVAGDEIGRTQNGNNNAYCQDNEISWLDWQRTAESDELFRFFKSLIRFRKEHRILTRRHYASDDGSTPTTVTWHGTELGAPDWSADALSLALELRDRDTHERLFLIANADWEERTFELPELPVGRAWGRIVDTSLAPPADVVESTADLRACAELYVTAPRSVVVLLAT